MFCTLNKNRLLKPGLIANIKKIPHQLYASLKIGIFDNSNCIVNTGIIEQVRRTSDSQTSHAAISVADNVFICSVGLQCSLNPPPQLHCTNPLTYLLTFSWVAFSGKCRGGWETTRKRGLFLSEENPVTFPDSQVGKVENVRHPHHTDTELFHNTTLLIRFLSLSE